MGGAILRCRGRSSSGGCRAGRRRPTAATARPGPTSGARTGHPAPIAGRHPSPTAARSVPYAELHCHSNFSFLDGASHPEELAEEAARLGLEALALTDHDGFYGIVRFAEAAAALGVPTVFGAELTLDLPRRSQQGAADPEGRHLLVLARDPDGYARLSRARQRRPHARRREGPAQASLDDLAASPVPTRRAVAGAHRLPEGHRAGRPRRQRAGRRRPRARPTWSTPSGSDSVAVELWDHGDPLDSARNDALVALAAKAGVDVVATNNVHYATPARRPLATALAAVRARRSLDELDGWLPASASACLQVGRRAGPPLRPLPRRGRAGGRDRPRVRLRPAAGRPQPARLPGARPATPR